MLRSATSLQGFAIEALDGEVGLVYDFLFEATLWSVRHMVVRTGKLFTRRKVLIAPAAIDRPDWTAESLHVRLTTEQVERSPKVDVEQPLTREQLDLVEAYYGWPVPVGAGTLSPVPLIPTPVRAGEGEDRPETREAGGTTLRSIREVTGYHIQAVEGEVGHVDDVVLNDTDWRIPYLVIDTRNWLPGRRVLVPSHSIQTIAWEDNKVHVNLSREALEESPGFEPAALADPEFEHRLKEYYSTHLV
jgi:hypothetical protein